MENDFLENRIWFPRKKEKISWKKKMICKKIENDFLEKRKYNFLENGKWFPTKNKMNSWKKKMNS